MADKKLEKQMAAIEVYAKAYANKFYMDDRGSGDDIMFGDARHQEALRDLRKFLSKRPTAASFAIGDHVRFKPPLTKHAAKFVGAINKLVVTDVKFKSGGGTLMYRLNGSPIEFKHSELLLVARASPYTVNKAYALMLGHGAQNEI